MYVDQYSIVKKPMTLGDVISGLEAKTDLSTTKRRDLISAVRTAARLLHRSPDDLPASVEALRDRLADIHPVQASISAKRLANVKSDLVAAIEMTATICRIRKRQRPRSAAWTTLVQSTPQKWQAYTLSRFSHFCSSQGIEPTDVSDAVLARFEEHLSKEVLTKKPEKIVKITRQTWNGLVERVHPELPALTKPPSRRVLTRDLSTYPASFQADIEAWIARLESVDFLEDDGPAKALRPTSLRNVRACLRQFADALVESGVKPDELLGLSDVVNPETVKRGLRYLRQRDGGNRPSHHTIMAQLIAVARYHVRVSGDIEKVLKSIQAKVAVAYDGMTDKNRDRLRQFRDERNIDLLLDLPRHLLAKAGKVKDASRNQALLIMRAVAIDILLACPMRIGNLSSLSIDQHLTWRGEGREQRVAIAIPGPEVKNGQPITIDLSVETSKLLDRYIQFWRPKLEGSFGHALFPQTDGKARTPARLGHDLSRLIQRETGIVMNAHLFRHLAALLFLDQHPGEYETVRRLLGHKNLNTTTKFYAPFETWRATERYETEVLQVRRAAK
ncbi:tyrosine-type recombinase/integrase [Georhizobium sp. MAB10]|uniref:tyrosine-type recombinase/integrase n=1 Tax=Georhizobium sp. MAB10 TaxID=3028319 RepID=UPI0038559D47